MKPYLVIILFLPLFFFAQQSAGIYSICYPIAPKLLQATRVQSTTNVGGVGNNSQAIVFNNSILPFATFLHDSVRITLEKFVGEVLSSEAGCIYKMNKKNKAIASSSFRGSIGGLPRNHLRNSIKFYDKDYYVRVKVRFGGYSVTTPSLSSIFGLQKGYIQPIVSIRIKAYNVERKKIYNRKINYFNFPKLKNYQVSAGYGTSAKVIRQEILSSDMIFSMLKETIREYKKKYLNQE